MSFLLAPQNSIFTIALGVVAALGLFEAFSLVLGISGVLSHLGIHEVDLGHADGDGCGSLSSLLSWFRVGDVPILIVLVVFLTCFGIVGFGIQAFALSTYAGLFPAAAAGTPALVLGAIGTRILSRQLARVLPHDETSAISDKSFLGKVAVITSGTARKGYPAEAKLRDQHGQVHYVMVESDTEGEIFQAGSSVLIVDPTPPYLKVIASKE